MQNTKIYIFKTQKLFINCWIYIEDFVNFIREANKLWIYTYIEGAATFHGLIYLELA